MKNLKKAFILMTVFTALNALVGGACYLWIGMAPFRGYMTGTALSFILSILWVLGAKKGMKANTMVLLTITLGGYPVRLLILGIFAFGGLYLIQMDTTYFALSFLVCTILSLIVEVWFFNTMTMPTKKKLN